MAAPAWLLGWATPARLLALLCTTCLLVLLDRGKWGGGGVQGGSSSP